ncbi:hypothetical protein MD484_g7558, partial [Candolleomyces efflorescens]
MQKLVVSLLLSEIAAKGSVCRYDARLLLDSFTNLTIEDRSPEPASPSSSSGWSDFPEDSRETFFLSNAEVEDYHRVKRRRLLDEARERRLKEREAEEASQSAKDNLDDDGELSPETRALMERTAKHLLSASNPAQLEMKIMANYGADQRFSFLRDGGRWHHEWMQVKARLNEEKSREEKEKKAGSGLGGLTGYGSESDSDSEGHDGGTAESDGRQNASKELSPPPPPAPLLPPPPSPPPEPSEGYGCDTVLDEGEKIKEERRARAREWMLKRKSDGKAEPFFEVLPQLTSAVEIHISLNWGSYHIVRTWDERTEPVELPALRRLTLNCEYGQFTTAVLEKLVARNLDCLTLSLFWETMYGLSEVIQELVVRSELKKLTLEVDYDNSNIEVAHATRMWNRLSAQVLIPVELKAL